MWRHDKVLAAIIDDRRPNRSLTKRRPRLNLLRMKPTTMAVLFLLLSGLSASAEPERQVAYIEETTVEPDGTTHTQRYKPGEAPLTVEGPQAGARAPRQRGLNTVEKLELDQLEADFAHGKISESEYNQKKRALYRATFVDGVPDDGIFNQSTQF